jgi:hypothetical protein
MKRVAPIAAVVLILLGIGLQFAPESFIGKPDKLDLVVAIYESDNQPVAEASLLAGQTANAARKAGKWRQFDKDKLPEKWKPALSTAVAKLGVPCLVLFRGEKAVASGRLPKTDADLAAFVESKGGF